MSIPAPTKKCNAAQGKMPCGGRIWGGEYSLYRRSLSRAATASRVVAQLVQMR